MDPTGFEPISATVAGCRVAVTLRAQLRVYLRMAERSHAAGNSQVLRFQDGKGDQRELPYQSHEDLIVDRMSSASCFFSNRIEEVSEEYQSDLVFGLEAGNKSVCLLCSSSPRTAKQLARYKWDP